MEAQARTVWILGAGFSRALGAPLFRDLFRSEHRVLAAFARFHPRDTSLRDKMLAVLGEYRLHAPEELGGMGGQHGLFWRDPEEFLDLVESATSGELAARDLLGTGTGKPSCEVLANMGRRALAIECSHFLRGANVQTERWLPYRTWAKQLSNNDTILTFNYDGVPELLHSQGGANLQVILPDAEAETKISEVIAQNGAPVYKLHGSVDWIAVNGKITADPSGDLPVQCADGNDLVLGVPGPDKAGLSTKYKALRFLWREALKAIERADRVVFVGYRFPPTDAEARVSILRSLKAGYDAKTLKQVKVVLGPNENDPHVARMKKLLSFVCQGVVDVLPLYAEDFLSLPAAWTTGLGAGRP